MKWMIASDIHGSAYYCRRLLEAYRKEQADRLLLLGDILYHGPRNDLPRDYAPKEVIAMLNPLKNEIYAVRGNCEAEVDQMVLEFPVMADYFIFIECYPRTHLQRGSPAAHERRRCPSARAYPCAESGKTGGLHPFKSRQRLNSQRRESKHLRGYGKRSL